MTDIRADAEGRPSLTVTAAAKACGVNAKTIRRRLARGDFPNAWQDRTPGQPLGPEGYAWRVPVVDLEAAGLRPNRADDEAEPALGESSSPHPSPSSTHTAASLEDDDSSRPELEELRGELERARTEAAEYRRRAEVAEAVAAERGKALERADRAIWVLEARTPRTAEPASEPVVVVTSPTSSPSSTPSSSGRLGRLWHRRK